ncbi:pre-peptidase C-terminal domain-containing protein [Nostoc sp.]|uniref:pre-peptidase C-terminal domain-containing protein n=1 Tax=Nostoc sp. TaxID=1180 RepID=UPI002FF6DBFC
MALSDLGILGSTPVVKNNSSLTTTDPTDVFEFKITDASNINLSLTNISAGDDADIALFRDANNNGVLDSFDRNVGLFSARALNQDDAINFKTSSGTFFAEVSRFASSSGDVSYDLALSATKPSGTIPVSDSSSNLLPKEFIIDNLLAVGNVTRTGNVSNTNTTDVYSFSLARLERVDIRLDGLSSDADIRVIRDSNNNRIVDAGEVIASSSRGGITPEQLVVDGRGDYFLQVTEFTGSTNYNVNFNSTIIPT